MLEMGSYNRIHVHLLLLFVLIISGSCINEEKNSHEEQPASEFSEPNALRKQITFTKDQFELSKLEIGGIEERKLSSIIKLTGIIEAEPSNVATVSAPLGGYVRTAGLLPGSHVSKGQILATLENPEFIVIQQEYLENIGRLEYLEQDYVRQQKLQQEDVNAAKTFQQVSSDLKVAKARIYGLEQKLVLIGIDVDGLRERANISRTVNVYAPITGYVKASNVNIGKFVTPSDVLFEIVGISRLHLALNAFEKDVSSIKVGQSVRFALSNEIKVNRSAKVFLLGRAIDDKNMIPVHCHFSDNAGLLPGMYVKAWVETGEEKKISVVSEAVVQLDGLDYVVILADDIKPSNGFVFQLLQVAKGVDQEGYTAIEFPKSVNPKQLKIVVNNSYTVLSAIKNAEEEE